MQDPFLPRHLFLDLFFNKSLEGMVYCFTHLHSFILQMSKAHLPRGKLVFICLVCELGFGGKKSIFYELLLAISSLSHVEEFNYYCLFNFSKSILSNSFLLSFWKSGYKE